LDGAELQQAMARRTVVGGSKTAKCGAVRALSLSLMILVLAACGSTPKRPQSKSQFSPAAVNMKLGVAYLKQGKMKVALEKLQRSLYFDPDYVDAHVSIAVLYERIGEPEKAEKHFLSAVRLAPKNPMVRNNYGTFLCRGGRVEQAQKNFLAAVKNPFYDTPEVAYTNAAICAWDHARDASAEHLFRQALDRNPKFASALISLAELLESKGAPFKASAFLQRYEAVGQPTAQSLWLGWRIETALGATDVSTQYRQKLLNQFPDSAQAKKLQKGDTG